MPASPDSYVSPFAPPPGEFSFGRGEWVVWVCVAACVLLWVSLIVGAPLAAGGGHETLALVIYQGLSGVCHQLPERAFWIAGHPLAVCARCSGIYAGFALVAVLYPLLRHVRRLPASGTPRREWLILALAPTTIDFTLGITGLWANTHLSRSLTGAWLGAWLAFYVVPGVLEIARQRRRREQQLRMSPNGNATTTASAVAFERK